VSLVELYKLRAGSDVEVRASKAKYDLAVVEEKRLKDLLDKGAAAPYEYEKARVSAVVASLELELNKQQHQETKLQLEQAEARHERFVMRAPIDGRIETILVAQGEAVEAGKPVLRLVETNPLWIDVPVPIDQTRRLKTGDPAWVESRLSGESRVIQGTIIFMGEIADAASATRTVQVEVQNKLGLPAGEHVTVSFTEPPGAAAGAAEKAGVDTAKIAVDQTTPGGR
jgi:RND family efflux transporter MFP subunit